jgi:hypothetical protein
MNLNLMVLFLVSISIQIFFQQSDTDNHDDAAPIDERAPSQPIERKSDSKEMTTV